MSHHGGAPGQLPCGTATRTLDFFPSLGFGKLETLVEPQVTLPSAAVWQIPAPLSIHNVQVDDDTSIVLRRHGNPNGPRLVLSHGNGLAIDLYYPFWSLLAGDFDLVVYDFRNHGWNDAGPLDDHSFDAIARDHDRISEAIAALYGEKPTVGVFHSISALAALHLPSRGSSYSALVLFTPPLCNTGSGYGEFELLCRRTADMLRVRTPWFQDREELADLHSYLPYFQLAVPGVYELVARTTLRESRTGQGYELRCPREYEAQIWDDAPVPAVSVDFGSLRCPTKIIASDPALDPDRPKFDFSGAGAAGVDHEILPGTTHFLQLEKPQECAAVMLDFLGRLGLIESPQLTAESAR